MSDSAQLNRAARRLAAALEPVAAQVYFAPECHREYVQLGFRPSPSTLDSGVQFPDGPAYFTSRGACLGQVPGQLVAAAFAVFNPDVVVPSVEFGWTRCDAATIAAARTRGGVAALVRILGEHPDGLERATSLLQRAVAPLRPEGRPLYAGLLSLGLPDDPMGAMWRLADTLREFRGDSHTASWISAGVDATEIGLLSEYYSGHRPGRHIRTRAWTEDQIEAAQERLSCRGLVDDAGLTENGRAAREAIEAATDRQCYPALAALGDELADLVDLLEPWGAAIRSAGGYPPK